MFVGAKCRPEDRQCFSTVITRIQCPCCASILPPHAPPVLGRSLSVSQAVGRAASLAYSAPLLGKASPCLYPAAIPPHLCRGEPRQKCSGQPGGSRFGCWRRQCRNKSATDCAGATMPGYAINVLPSFEQWTVPVQAGEAVCPPFASGLLRSIAPP